VCETDTAVIEQKG